MDKYHIYEEIGKGEFSQVFKGREKKKIEYVAIKRVEKSMMSKVVINSYPSVILCTLTIDSKS
jgi:serine/threonine-protein kinase ULK4